MSLLNKMLQDLEYNKKKQSNAAFLLMSSPQSPKRDNILYIIYFTVVVLFVTELLYLIKNKDNNISNLTQQSPIVNTIQEAQTVSIQDSPIEPSVEPPVEPSVLDPIPWLQTHSDIDAIMPKIMDAKINDMIVEDTSVVEEDDLLHKKFNLPANEWYDTQLDKALESIKNGDDQAGIDRLNLIISKYPAAVDARETLGALLLSQGNFIDANLIIEEGLEFQPRALNLVMLKVRLLLEEKNAKAALTMLEKFQPNIQKNPDYYGLLAVVYETLGRYIDAGSLYQTLIEVDPENGQYWVGLGLALEEKNAKTQAMDAYRHASQSSNIKPEVRAYAENRLRTLEG